MTYGANTPVLPGDGYNDAAVHGYRHGTFPVYPIVPDSPHGRPVVRRFWSRRRAVVGTSAIAVALAAILATLGPVAWFAAALVGTPVIRAAIAVAGIRPRRRKRVRR